MPHFDAIVSVLDGSDDHSDRVLVAEVTDLRGDALERMGQLLEAREAEERCWRTLEAINDSKIPIGTSCRTEMLAIDARRGRCEDVKMELGRQVDRAGRQMGASHPNTSAARVWDAYCRLQTGEVEHGVSELHAVLEAFVDHPESPSARFARDLLDAHYWGLPVETVLDP